MTVCTASDATLLYILTGRDSAGDTSKMTWLRFGSNGAFGLSIAFTEHGRSEGSGGCSRSEQKTRDLTSLSALAVQLKVTINAAGITER